MKKIVCLLILGNCSVLLATQVRLVLNWKPEAEFGGFYAAEISGAFEKEKLKVEIIPGGVGTPAVQMVASGKAEFGIASADEVVLSRDRGTDVIALYAVYQTNPQAFLVRESRSVKALPDIFQSGVVAAQRGLPYFLYLEKKYGPFKAAVVPYLGGVAQLKENPDVAQQCFVTSEPILAARQGLKTKTFLVADSGFNPYTAVVVFRRSFLEQSPGIVAAFKRAIDAGWKQYLKSPSAANALMHKLNPSMDMETLAQSAQIQKALIETPVTKQWGLGSMGDARWVEIATQLKSLGLIKQVLPAGAYYLK